MNRPYARHPPSRPTRTRIEGVRIPASLKHLLGGGEPYDYTEPRCRVCMSEHRWFIESLVSKGIAYERIAKRVPLDGRGRKVDRRSISRHYRLHMPPLRGRGV